MEDHRGRDTQNRVVLHLPLGLPGFRSEEAPLCEYQSQEARETMAQITLAWREEAKRLWP